MNTYIFALKYLRQAVKLLTWQICAVKLTHLSLENTDCLKTVEQKKCIFSIKAWQLAVQKIQLEVQEDKLPCFRSKLWMEYSTLPLRRLKTIFLIPFGYFWKTWFPLLVQNITDYCTASLKSTVRCQRLWVVSKVSFSANLTCMWRFLSSDEDPRPPVVHKWGAYFWVKTEKARSIFCHVFLSE